MQLHDPSVLLSQGAKATLVPINHNKDDQLERKCSICLETISERT